MLLWDPPLSCLFSRSSGPDLSDFAHKRNSPLSLLCPQLHLLSHTLSFLNYQAQNWTHHLPQCGHASFDSLKIRLPFWAVYRHCWLMSNCLSTDWMKTPYSKSFSVGLLSVHSSPSLLWYWGLLQARCCTLYLALLELMRFPWAHSSSQSGSSGCHPLPTVCQLCHYIISTLAEGALCLTVRAIKNSNDL